MKTIDWTDWALTVRNTYDYGDYTNGEIVGEWGDDDCKAFCKDYIEFIYGTNGISEMYDWEKELAKELGITLE